MNDKQYRAKLAQYQATIDQCRQDAIKRLIAAGKLPEGATWSDEVEDLLVSEMEAHERK